LIAVWGAGVVIVLLPILAGWARLRGIYRRATRPVIELADCLDAPFCRSRRPLMLQGDELASPMTWGVLRPVILLPGCARAWPRERLRAVLLHELAHVARWDCLTIMLARLACAVYWFHPLVWIAARRLRIESEHACDDMVMQAGVRATEYARDLLEVARSSRPPRGLAAAVVPMAQPLQLEGRLRAILDPSQSHHVVSRRGACLLFAVAALLLLPLSTARLAARDDEPAAAAKGAGQAVRSARMTVSGRALDADGRPVPGAKVAILGRRKLAALTARSDDQHIVLGRAEAGAGGRFELDVPRTSSLTYYELHALAFRAGLALGWSELNRDAEAPSVDVRLMPEQLIEARLVDLQGAAASGVTIRTASLGIAHRDGSRFDGINLPQAFLEGLDGIWPDPVVSDAEGQFQLAGIGGGVRVGFQVDGPNVARQYLGIQNDAKAGQKRATLALQPALRVNGRITAADTGAPLANAVVMVGTGTDRFRIARNDYRTDADGRYEANPSSGTFVSVTVYPPVGSPYLIFQRNLKNDDGAARREMNLEVPRGVLVKGRITERGTGRPLAGASVYYENGKGNVVEGKGTIPGWMSAITSGPDGRYAIAVAPGKGQLRVYAATADFAHEVQGANEGVNGKPGGKRIYAHTFVPYEVKAAQGPNEIDVALVPAVTVAGRVVGPAGQSIDKAEIVTTLSISPFHSFWRGDFTIPVRDGHFELHGVAPDRHYKCSFLDTVNGWGTTVDVTAALADQGPLTVQLQQCGSASLRLIDDEGHPVPKGTALLNLVATPGPGTDYGGDSLTEAERSMLTADEEIYANIDRQHYWNSPKADRDGRLTLPLLIPGATYRVYEYTRGKSGHAQRWRDFTVEPGQTTDLGDVRVSTGGR
jgi:hypothetical protein